MPEYRFRDRNPIAFLAISYSLWIRHIIADFRSTRRAS